MDEDMKRRFLMALADIQDGLTLLLSATRVAISAVQQTPERSDPTPYRPRMRPMASDDPDVVVAWEAMLGSLGVSLPKEEYERLVSPVVPLRIDRSKSTRGVLILAAPNKAVEDAWKKWAGQVLDALKATNVEAMQFEFLR